MPTYSYLCGSCGHKFDLRQGFDSESIAKCPKCEAEAKRQFIPVPIIFKGSGWYVNDSGRKGSAQGLGPHQDSGDSNKESSDDKGSTDSDVISGSENSSKAEVSESKESSITGQGSPDD